jgi:predicted dehydrogenase
MHIAVIGLGFGQSFVPIYAAHPLVSEVTICDSRAELVQDYLERWTAGGSVRAAESFDAVLADKSIDAVHILTPVPLHAQQVVATLRAGKHCACAVPLAVRMEDLEAIVAAAKASGRVTMMMETGNYTREFLYLRGMLDRGELGELTFVRGDYYQDLEAPYPAYWRQVPPMHYATHVVGPLCGLVGEVAKVSCVGVGRIRPDLAAAFPEIPAYTENPFPMQVATLRFSGSDVVGQISRAWYQVASEYEESFSAYGDKAGFEWPQIEGEDPVVFELDPVQAIERWRGAKARRVSVPFRPDLVPEPLQRFADGGHGGAHPHLAHEFVSAIAQGRASAIDAARAAHWCAVGIVAHDSSLREGEWLSVPTF